MKQAQPDHEVLRPGDQRVFCVHENVYLALAQKSCLMRTVILMILTELSFQNTPVQRAEKLIYEKTTKHPTRSTYPISIVYLCKTLPKTERTHRADARIVTSI